MEYLPVCLRLRDAPVALIGGGGVATRKARLLLRAGANLTVIAPAVIPELERLLSEAGGIWQQGVYRQVDLQGKVLVVAATPDHQVNRQIHADACARNIPVNVVDSPALCTFIFPTIIDRDPVLVAITSSGRSPVLARALRRRVESMLPAAFGRLADFAGRMRERVKAHIPEEGPRRLFWEQTVDGAVGELVLAGREGDAEVRLEQQLQETSHLHRGEVYLVGAGPGDPDLMTFRAMRLLQSADVVLYDRLVDPRIVDMARRDAQRIYVGKRRAEHTLPQPRINQLLLELAQAGRRVVRLKGGDPFIFGRGGEEIELLARHRIPFQVVPGITAASGAACYAGIPLTHRDYAQSVRFVAGYLKGNRIEHDWSRFDNPGETLVFYMGLAGLPEICRQLQRHGRSPDTPAALIGQGTLATQQVLTGTLATLPAIVAAAAPRAPTLIIVGEVVRLHDDLAWFGPGGSGPAPEVPIGSDPVRQDPVRKDPVRKDPVTQDRN